MSSQAQTRNTSVKMVEVDQGSDDRRLDNYLISILRGVPRSHIYSIIRTGQVRVNRGRAKAGQRLKIGDLVRIPPVRTTEKAVPASVSPILKKAVNNIIFEDEYMVAVDKPTGVTVHAGSRHNFGFIEAMRFERPDFSYIELVHRLDKDTSGILILARDKRFLRDLHTLWRRESEYSNLVKRYSALVRGRWERGARTIETSHSPDTMKFKSDKLPQVTSVSTFTPIKEYSSCTLVEIELHTGKTHQARRHALQIGRPIAGDRKFGSKLFNEEMRNFGLKRMFLHAQKIKMLHPVTEEFIEIECNLPTELTDVLSKLETCEN